MESVQMAKWNGLMKEDMSFIKEGVLAMRLF
jgi:hypothetical protein